MTADARARDLTLILVSNEVGMGLVPPFPLGRHYRDMLGRLNQAAAKTADSVVLMIAGLPVDLRRLTHVFGLGDGDEPPGGKGREVVRDPTDGS
ncbi:MAG: bifunctional adenosylcobinamide kinase/adenosylcobinamide-phosphate guanylyltransferase [Chloroflexota bacterium]|nr:bifunctional adenosylcobinamide kinase/adenosylcobinamide-phosphate guanylyltransferase [Chloroflexota bacterium]